MKNYSHAVCFGVVGLSLLAGCGAEVSAGTDSAESAALTVRTATPDALAARTQVGSEAIQLEVKTEQVTAVVDDAPVTQRRLHVMVRGDQLYAETLISLDEDGTREDMEGSIAGHSFGGAGDAETDSDGATWASAKSGHTAEVLRAISVASQRELQNHPTSQAKNILEATGQMTDLLDSLGTGQTLTLQASRSAETNAATAQALSGSIYVGWESASIWPDTDKWHGWYSWSGHYVGTKIYEWYEGAKERSQYVSSNHYGNPKASVDTQRHGDCAQTKGWLPNVSGAKWSIIINWGYHSGDRVWASCLKT